MGNLVVEFLREDDQILTVSRESQLCRVLRIPDSGFAHEAESGFVHDRRHGPGRVRSKEDRCAEDPLESRNETAVLRSALLHSERVEHLGGVRKVDASGTLASGQSREKEGDQPILSPRETVSGVTRNEQDELA